MDVRQQFISARGLSAVLVFIAASRATDGSLEEQSTHAQSTKDVIGINHRLGKASKILVNPLFHMPSTDIVEWLALI